MRISAYEQVTECGEWLEDSGSCSRYGTDAENSIWVCHDCMEVIDDPTEHECDEDDEIGE